MSRTIYSPTPKPPQITDVLSISQGGLGANNIEDAVTNLGGISLTRLGASGGIAQLDSNGLLPSQMFSASGQGGVTLSGPTSLVINQTGTYIITNYNSFKTYTIEAISGSVFRAGDLIVYNAPADNIPAGFTINGRAVNIAMGTPNIQAPNITTPVNNATNVGSSYTFTSSPFTIVGGTDIHIASDWQLATDSTFNNLVKSVSNDASNKLSWTVSGLTANTVYYVRVRYKGNGFGYGPWSSANTFTTALVFIPSAQTSIITASDKSSANTIGFGNSVALSRDGTRLVVGMPARMGTDGVARGAIYVYLRSGNFWNEEAILTDNALTAQEAIGNFTAITSDGSRIAVTYPTASGSGIIVFKRDVTTWTKEQGFVIPNPDGVTSGFYKTAMFIEISDDGTRLAVNRGTKVDTVNNQVGQNYRYGCYVDVYSRVSSSWISESNLLVQYTSESSSISFVPTFPITMSAAGDRILIGVEHTFAVTGTTGAVEPFVKEYVRSGNTWTAATDIKSNVTWNNQNYTFGSQVKISGNGLVLAVASSYHKAVYVFNRSGSNWVYAETISLTSDIKDIISLQLSTDGSLLFVTGGSRTEIGTGIFVPGICHIYKKNSGTWVELSTLSLQNDTASSGFGYHTAVSGVGETLAITAHNQTVTSSVGEGSVYIYN